MLDQKRNEIQNEAIDKWVENNYIGTLNLSTGIGKTFCFFKSVILSCKPGDHILFLAETKQREIDLFADLEKFETIFKVNLRQYNIQFDCYQSAYKWKDQYFDLVCADEIHMSLTPAYYKFYVNNEYAKLLGLSATVDRSVKYLDEDNNEYNKGDLLDKIAPVIFEYNLNDAVTDNTTKKLNIYVIYHQLDDQTKTVIGGTKDKPFLTTEKSAYDYWDKEFKRALFMSEGQAKTFRIRNTSAARAKVLYNLESKVLATKQLLSILKGKTIIFNNSLESLKKVCSNVINGKNTDKINKQIRENFDNGTINTIGSFKMLKQGANLSNLDNTVIMSYFSKELDMIQMLGRQRNSDQTGNVFIFLTIGTQETKWFESAMGNIVNYQQIYCNGINDAIKKYQNNL